MMKLLLSVLLVIPFATACTFKGACTKSNIAAQCSEVNSFTEEEVKQACDEAAFDFGEVSHLHFQGDDNFMDGVGALNEGTEGDAPLHVEAGRVLRFRSNAADNNRILWPQYEALETYTEAIYPASSPPGVLDNFDGCELRAAICCFTDTRDASPISTNAQVCDIDLGASRHSSRVYRGFGSLDSNAYCVGMAWKEDENDVTNHYKGNMLFDIAYGTFLDDKYTKSIPGAPLCGCMEKMPTITAANCRTVKVTGESYTLAASGGSLSITQDASTTVEYKDCGDLKTYYNTISSANEQKKLAARITGTCDADAYLNNEFFVRDANIASGRYAQAAGTASWEQVAGLGLSYFPTKTWDMTVRDTAFRNLIGSGPSFKIIYRHCESCLPSHQHIFYKRLTALPDSGVVNFLNYFMNNWVETNNVMDTDFKLYSTLDDAQSDTNAWGYCAFDNINNGFPGTCAPGDHFVPCMWNTHEGWTCGNSYNAKSHGFYVET